MGLIAKKQWLSGTSVFLPCNRAALRMSSRHSPSWAAMVQVSGIGNDGVKYSSSARVSAGTLHCGSKGQRFIILWSKLQCNLKALRSMREFARPSKCDTQ